MGTEAGDVIKCMCENVTETRAISALLSQASHKNAAAKARVAECLDLCIERMVRLLCA